MIHFRLECTILKRNFFSYRDMSEISPMQYTAENPVQSSFLNMAPKVKKEGL